MNKYLVGAIAVFAYVFGLVTCNSCHKSDCPPAATIQKTTKDTTKKQLPKEESPVRIPSLAKVNGKPATIKDREKQDTFIMVPALDLDSLIQQAGWANVLMEKYSDLLFQYNSMFEAYNKEREYTDTTRFSNGRVIVWNKVAQDQVRGQRVTLDSLQQVTITNSITNTVAQKKRVLGYLGVMGAWQSDRTMYVGASAGLKFKNEFQFHGFAMLNTNGQNLFGGKLDVPILNRKHR
jgi:hypothetical protein